VPSSAPRSAARQVRNAGLLAEFEAILLELRRRLDSYLELSHNDIFAADEGFNLAGQFSRP
jgi:hypothetical protein